VSSKTQRGVQVRTRSHLKATAAVSLALTLLLVGCTSSQSAPPGPTTSSTDATSSSTPPSTPEEQAKTQVLAMLPTYFRTINELYNDPKKSPNDIYLVATEPEAGAELKAVNAARVAGIRSSGFTKLVSAQVTAVDLTNEPQGKPRVLPTIKVTTCVDVSGVHAMGKDGKSVVPADRKQFLISRLMVVNYKYPSASTWVVSNAPNREADSCAA
jgi:hypothetical protein